jgi:hypothetical protein
MEKVGKIFLEKMSEKYHMSLKDFKRMGTYHTPNKIKARVDLRLCARFGCNWYKYQICK